VIKATDYNLLGVNMLKNEADLSDPGTEHYTSHVTMNKNGLSPKPKMFLYLLLDYDVDFFHTHKKIKILNNLHCHFKKKLISLSWTTERTVNNHKHLAG
jgi:hypothetical protein